MGNLSRERRTAALIVRASASALFALALISGAAGAADVPVPGNYGESLDWYERAADAGNPKAQYLLGVLIESGQRGAVDPADAAAWYAKAAAGGHAAAQLRLGQMFYAGRGVGRDLAQARRWYAAAAAQGLDAARYAHALMLERGQGGPRDATAAARAYEVAATNGHLPSRVNLAMLIARGDGVVRDPVLALAWLVAAERDGQQGLGPLRDALAAELSAAQRDTARDQAAQVPKAVVKAPPAAPAQ